ncbi:DUF1178 family protein [Pelagibacteraceae bacterium]|nr:DUF1178 family protein [Pelagibacteraceae bacterium]MDC3156326.1 DUF1178 family protein [Pelagibacteraceae bacterium]
MIVFNLNCSNCTFSFEGWFENTKDYNKQIKKGLVSCPSCNSIQIKKGLMAPYVSKKSNSKISKRSKPIASNVNKLKKIIEKEFDYVGDKFTEEAKGIKYGEVKERPIYGEASIEQTKELIDEDIDVLPLPFSTKKTN